MGKIRILLADDHNVMRDGLRVLLERHPDFEVVAEAADGLDAVRRAQEHAPDVAVMDIAMPTLNGIEATRRIVESHPATAVVILSMHVDESYVLRSLKAGARGYLLKDSAKADLINAIQAVHEGKSFLSPGVSRLLQDDYLSQLESRGVDSRYDLLTDREREILHLVAEGNTNKEIASRLGVSPYTIETHRAHILQKLGLHSGPELILYAVRKGLVH